MFYSKKILYKEFTSLEAKRLTVCRRDECQNKLAGYRLNAKRKFLTGFTLIEVIVALLVFLIIMLSLSDTFTQSFSSYRNTRAVQRDVENAQFALNLLSKELRTSTIVSPDKDGSVTSVRFFDYSQNRCFEYKIASNQLTVSKRESAYTGKPAGFDPVSECSGSLGNVTVLVQAKNLTGDFVVIPSNKSSNPKKLGRVTVSLHISEGPKHTANVQTTSSLRDYGYIGLIGQ